MRNFFLFAAITTDNQIVSLHGDWAVLNVERTSNGCAIARL